MRIALVAPPWAPIPPVSYEPFGMVMIEALRAGPAIGDVSRIDRRACRVSVEERFSVERMVGEHLDLFRELIGADGSR